jgi:hypothetical protein
MAFRAATHALTGTACGRKYTSKPVRILQGETDMMRHWLAGAAALAMMTGVAVAEESSTTTRSTTTSTVPAVGNYKATETHRGTGWGIEHYKWRGTERGTDRDGYATRSKKTYHSNANGSTVTSKTRTETPDGSRTTYREKETVPNSGSSIEKKSTTTIDR